MTKRILLAGHIKDKYSHSQQSSFSNLLSADTHSSLQNQEQGQVSPTSNGDMSSSNFLKPNTLLTLIPALSYCRLKNKWCSYCTMDCEYGGRG